METRTIIAASVVLLCAASSSFALEVGVGGAGVSVEIGGSGASVGAGEADVGVGESGVSVGVGGTSLSVGSDGSIDASVGGTPGEEGTVQGSAPDAAARIDGSGGDSAQPGLPVELRPAGLINCPTRRCRSTNGSSDSGMGIFAGLFPSDVLNACRATVVQAAQAYGMVDVTVSRYGPTRRLTDGGQLAHIFTRITYQHEKGYEVREAPIWCRLDDAGAVSALLDS